MAKVVRTISTLIDPATSERVVEETAFMEGQMKFRSLLLTLYLFSVVHAETQTLLDLVRSLLTKRGSTPGASFFATSLIGSDSFVSPGFVSAHATTPTPTPPPLFSSEVVVSSHACTSLNEFHWTTLTAVCKSRSCSLFLHLFFSCVVSCFRHSLQKE